MLPCATAPPLPQPPHLPHHQLPQPRQLLHQPPVPRVEELDRDDWVYEQDYMRDLPYDYTTLVENIIDPRLPV